MGVALNFVKTVFRADNKAFLRSVRGMESSWGRFSKGFLGSIAPMGAALGAGGLAAAIIKTGATFEQSMANIKAVTRSSAEEMLAMETRARQLGATTSYSASEVAKGMTVIARSTGDASKAVAGIEAVLKLAGSEGADMTLTAETLISTLNAFQLQFSEANRVANVFAATSQNTRQSIERLAEGMKNAAPLAKEMGASVEEISASLGILIDNGLEASQTGTNLRAALTDIVRGSGELNDALVGVSVETHGVVGVLDALAKAGIEGEEAFAQFNVRGAQAISILVSQRERLRQLMEQITGTNAAWEAYDVQQDTLIGAAKRVLSALEEVAIAVFQTFGTDLKNFADDLARAIVNSRDKIAEFAIDVGRNVRIAMAHLQVFIDQWPTLWAAIADGMSRVNFGEMMRAELLPGGKTAGEVFAESFGEGFNAKWFEIRETMMTNLGPLLMQIDEWAYEQKARLGQISLEAPPDIPFPNVDLPALPEQELAGAAEATQTAWSLAIETMAKALKATQDIEVATIDAQTKMADSAFVAQVSANAIAGAYYAATSAITQANATMAERIKGAFAGIIGAFAAAMQQMVAQALVTKLELEAIFQSMNLGVLGLVGVGLGFIANKFHSGGIVGGGGERLIVAEDGEAVIDRQTTQANRGIIDSLLSAKGRQVPQLSLAGSGGASRMEFHTHVNVPRGSLLLADRVTSLRRVADTLNRVTETTVKRAYRE